MSQSLFTQPLNVINVGIAMFSDDLKNSMSMSFSLTDAARSGQHAGRECAGQHCQLAAGGENRRCESAGAGANYPVSSRTDWI